MSDAILALITLLATVINSLILAKGDKQKEEEAMLVAVEGIKAELDKRKFGSNV